MREQLSREASRFRYVGGESCGVLAQLVPFQAVLKRLTLSRNIEKSDSDIHNGSDIHIHFRVVWRERV